MRLSVTRSLVSLHHKLYHLQMVHGVSLLAGQPLYGRCANLVHLLAGIACKTHLEWLEYIQHVVAGIDSNALCEEVNGFFVVLGHKGGIVLGLEFGRRHC